MDKSEQTNLAELRGQNDIKVEFITLEAKNVDEALEIVGTTRTSQFEEDFYLRVRTKLDWVIPPLAAAVYFTQFLDKNTLNYASIMGFPIHGQEYNLVALAFYIGFFAWEFPTVFISQKLPLGKYLGANVICWGVVLMCHAIPTSFAPLFVLRILLGMLESCVAPILILIISMFYKKDEQARRISWFYVMNGLTQIFGAFVAYGISFDVNSRFAPYRILYVLLGILAVVVGICVVRWMPDSPVHAKLLTHEERIAALARIREDQGGTENRRFKKYQVYEALTDVRTWLIVMSTFLTSIPQGGLGNFSNIIVESFGYTAKQTLILNAPGGLLASLSTLFLAWLADKGQARMIPIVLSIIPTLVGAGMLIGLKPPAHKGALLFASYIVGIYGSALSLLYAYNASNTAGHTKKATINAMTLAAFAIGNIVGTETFQPKDSPNFLPGKVSIMVLLSTELIICVVLRWMNLRLNRNKQREIEILQERNGWSDEDVRREREKYAFLDLTDKQYVIPD